MTGQLRLPAEITTIYVVSRNFTFPLGRAGPPAPAAFSAVCTLRTLKNAYFKKDVSEGGIKHADVLSQVDSFCTSGGGSFRLSFQTASWTAFSRLSGFG